MSGHSSDNSTHVGLVSGELGCSVGDRSLHSKKKKKKRGGGLQLICDYWPTDVRASATCLVKRKKFEVIGERGLLCNTLH